MEPLARATILASFPKKQRKLVELPNLEETDWAALDFLGWRHTSGHLAYVVYEQEDRIRGLVLRLTPSGGTHQCMCSWCMTVHQGGGVALFTAEASGTHRIHGVYVCANLQCSAYVRGSKRPNGCQMRETIGREQRIARLRSNMERFFRLVDGQEMGGEIENKSANPPMAR